MKIAVMGAMDEEIALYLAEMKTYEEFQFAGMPFYVGSLRGQDIVLCKSGVGKVNAAVATQLLVDRFQVGALLFTGVAGAIDTRLRIGDLIISTDCVQHDVDVTALGYQPGEIPYVPQIAFPADPSLVQLAVIASQEEVPGQQVFTGRVVSGDQFIADSKKVTQLKEIFQASCTEMEGAAVAQVCWMNQLPFVVIRSMSDQADGEAEVSYHEFMHVVAEHSYLIITGMLDRWDM